jgi:hypothetical protein
MISDCRLKFGRSESEICNRKSEIGSITFLPAGKSSLVGSLIVASLAAGLAVHEAIFTETNVHARLTETAEFLALTRTFDLFALGAFVAGGSGSGTHAVTLT